MDNIITSNRIFINVHVSHATILIGIVDIAVFELDFNSWQHIVSWDYLVFVYIKKKGGQCIVIFYKVFTTHSQAPYQLQLSPSVALAVFLGRSALSPLPIAIRNINVMSDRNPTIFFHILTRLRSSFIWLLTVRTFWNAASPFKFLQFEQGHIFVPLGALCLGEVWVIFVTIWDSCCGLECWRVLLICLNFLWYFLILFYYIVCNTYSLRLRIDNW